MTATRIRILVSALLLLACQAVMAKGLFINGAVGTTKILGQSGSFDGGYGELNWGTDQPDYWSKGIGSKFGLTQKTRRLKDYQTSLPSPLQLEAESVGLKNTFYFSGVAVSQSIEGGRLRVSDLDGTSRIPFYGMSLSLIYDLFQNKLISFQAFTGVFLLKPDIGWKNDYNGSDIKGAFIAVRMNLYEHTEYQ